MWGFGRRHLRGRCSEDERGVGSFKGRGEGRVKPFLFLVFGQDISARRLGRVGIEIELHIRLENQHYKIYRRQEGGREKGGGKMDLAQAILYEKVF